MGFRDVVTETLSHTLLNISHTLLKHFHTHTHTLMKTEKISVEQEVEKNKQYISIP